MVWQSEVQTVFHHCPSKKKCIWAAPNLLNESFEHYGLRIHWIAPLYRGCCVFTIMVGQLSACRCEVHLRMTIQVKSQYYAQALWPSPRAGRWRLARVRAQEHAWEWVLARPRRGGRPAPACAGDSAVVGHEWDSGVLTLLLPGGSRRQARPTGRHRSARSKQACLPLPPVGIHQACLRHSWNLFHQGNQMEASFRPAYNYFNKLSSSLRNGRILTDRFKAKTMVTESPCFSPISHLQLTALCNISRPVLSVIIVIIVMFQSLGFSHYTFE